MVILFCFNRQLVWLCLNFTYYISTLSSVILESSQLLWVCTIHLWVRSQLETWVELILITWVSSSVTFSFPEVALRLFKIQLLWNMSSGFSGKEVCRISLRIIVTSRIKNVGLTSKYNKSQEEKVTYSYSTILFWQVPVQFLNVPAFD